MSGPILIYYFMKDPLTLNTNHGGTTFQRYLYAFTFSGINVQNTTLLKENQTQYCHKIHNCNSDTIVSQLAKH